MTWQVIAHFQFCTSILFRLYKCCPVAISSSTRPCYERKTLSNKKAILSGPLIPPTDLGKRGRSLSLLTDGLSKQMRNQNVCVVICGFRPLFACHYQLLSGHKVFIHTFTLACYGATEVNRGEEHTRASLASRSVSKHALKSINNHNDLSVRK